MNETGAKKQSKKCSSLIIGVCGRSGSGKTTAVEYLASFGCRIIDADVFARRVMKKGSGCLEEIKERFGGGVFLPSGELDRKALANIVFSNEKKRLELNAITLKYIVASMKKSAAYYKGKNEKYIVYDAPLLFESGLDKECDCIVSVIANDKDCADRITERDGISKADAENRLRSQKSNDYLKSNSDYIIFNNGSLEKLKTETKAVFDSISESK